MGIKVNMWFQVHSVNLCEYLCPTQGVLNCKVFPNCPDSVLQVWVKYSWGYIPRPSAFSEGAQLAQPPPEVGVEDPWSGGESSPVIPWEPPWKCWTGKAGATKHLVFEKWSVVTNMIFECLERRKLKWRLSVIWLTVYTAMCWTKMNDTWVL